MKHLTLLRHAKSSWDSPGARDFDRPLNERGVGDAPRMGLFMAEHWDAPPPDLILVSPARRTLQTLELLLPAAGLGFENVKLVPGLYLASESRLLELIQNTDDDVAHLWITGHNPGVEMACGTLSPADAKTGAFPTCAVARLSFRKSRWSDVGEDSAVGVRFQVPRELP